MKTRMRNTPCILEWMQLEGGVNSNRQNDYFDDHLFWLKLVSLHRQLHRGSLAPSPFRVPYSLLGLAHFSFCIRLSAVALGRILFWEESYTVTHLAYHSLPRALDCIGHFTLSFETAHIVDPLYHTIFGKDEPIVIGLRPNLRLSGRKLLTYFIVTNGFRSRGYT